MQEKLENNHSLFVPMILMILFQVSPDTNITLTINYLYNF